MRTESQRVHHEFEAFYAKHPEYRLQANHRIFLDAANQDGGSEVLDAEWMEQQIGSLPLAVLRETPDQALNKFMAENPGFDCEANRKMIAERIGKTNETVQEAVSALPLAFNQEIAEEHSAQKQIEERQSLIEEIAAAYSRDENSRSVERKRLQAAGYLSLDPLRAKAREIADRKRYRGMSSQELKQIVRNTPAAGPTLPAEWTKEKIRRTDSQTLRKLLDRFGHDVVNARLAGRN